MFVLEVQGEVSSSAMKNVARRRSPSIKTTSSDPPLLDLNSKKGLEVAHLLMGFMPMPVILA